MDKTDVGFVVMDLFFNDASSIDLEEDTLSEVFKLFAEVAREAHGQGFTGIRFDKSLRDIKLTHNNSFAQYCQRNSKDQVVRAILSLAKYPYFESTEEDEYLNATDFVVEISAEDTRSVYGLAAAFVYESVGIGFCTPGWDKLMYKVSEIDGQERSGVVLCLSQKSHFVDPCYANWAEKYLPEPVLIKSSVIPMDKHRHFSDHHGTDVLDRFADKILSCPYVEEVINSIDRNSEARHFIERIHDDIIEIRLVKGGGYGLAIRTTARNMLQLRKIARVLEEKYS